ncbi:MAG: SHOCT domain-containing protein [Thiohalocapsa sp.]
MKTLASKSLASIAAVLVPASAWAADGSAEPYNWGPHMMWGWGWSGMVFGPLFMILTLAVLIAAAVFIARFLGGPWHAGPWSGTAPPHYPASGGTPLDILKERFARGEIDQKEFEDRRRVLAD